MTRRVIVGLSGGVDSAVSAALLIEAGHEVEGLFMRNWAEDDAYCTAAEDYESARAVAAQLDIPLHQADFSAEYRERVFTDFLAEYQAGRTPSPDLLCNREIKFGEFARHAQQLGAEAIATGHYARLAAHEGQTRLLRARDSNKDQTYFLAATPGTALRDVLFPLGDYEKNEVRALARERGLVNHRRPDSTGVCFIGERPMREFLQHWIAVQPGAIETDEGQVIGEHQGVALYTLGQRGGLGIGGVRGHAEAPWYVVERDVARNVLVVSQDRGDARLNPTRLTLGQCYWVNEPPKDGAQYGVRVRHRHRPQTAVYRAGPPARLEFAQPVWAPAPGQFAVLYAEEQCLGCGVIEAARIAD